jgi:hypothetical protein
MTAMDETRYLLSSPRNAKLLRKGIAELNAGKGVQFDPAHSKPPKKFVKLGRAMSHKQRRHK